MGRRIQGLLLVSPPMVVVAMFIGFPIVTAILYTLGYTGGANSGVAALAEGQHEGHGSPTLAAYREVLNSPDYTSSLWVTVWVTLISTILVVCLSWAVALYVRLAKTRLAKTLAVLAVVPLFIPSIIASYAILNFYGGTGFVRSVWPSAPNLAYTNTAVVVAQVWTSVPLGVLLIMSGVNAIPDALIDAARDAGARLPAVIRSIILPMTLLPTVIAASFTAIFVLGSFTVPYVTGPTAHGMLGVTMANYFGSFNRPQQSEVMAVSVFVIAAGIGFAYVWANLRDARRAGTLA
jgi:ABC-type spermidine/putrescine transport system permease subunit I